MKCYYHGDQDGKCAGAIVNKSKPGCEFIEVNYKDEIDISKIDNGEQIFVVDFSFKPDLMKQVLEKTKDIVWLDHHKTAFEYEDKYLTKIEGIRSNDFSGCELAWQHFFPGEKMPEAVRLIGDRDKWAWKFGTLTANFNAGMTTIPHQPEDVFWGELLSNNMDLFNRIIKDGSASLRFRDRICEGYADRCGFETNFEGYRCFALNLTAFGNEAFKEKREQYDILILFSFDGEMWNISLYSDTVDVAEIAKRFGGGGHKGASGFYREELPFKKG